MNHFPMRRLALPLVLATGCGLGAMYVQRHPNIAFLASAAAQTTSAAPVVSSSDSAAATAAVEQKSPAGMAHTDTKGRHLAPHDTFYLLTYVSATTDKGVEGFEPGQEVHLVEVRRPTHTLVVSDGRADVEVAPSKLTNDMEIAALVRSKDQAKQAQIAAYIQSEETAYTQAEQKAADAAAKDIDQHEKEQAAESRVAAAPAAQPASAQIDATSVGNGNGESGYYAPGGYGYGNPYSYFSGGTVVVLPKNAASAPAKAAPVAPAAPAGKVAAPAGGGGRPR